MRTISMTMALVLSAGTASAFTAINGLSVRNMPQAGQFEVISERGAGPRQIWCAGAQYANIVQGLSGNTRVYIVQGLGPSATAPGYKSVVFTTQPGATLESGPKPGDGGNYSVSLTKTGYSLRVAHAEGFCDTILQELD